MRTSRFSESEVVSYLRQAEEGTLIRDICRKAGVSDTTFYTWRKKYAHLIPSELKRLRRLRDENAMLKKIVTELKTDNERLSNVLANQ